MNCYDGKHWDIYEILPYQRKFNFINAIRKIGKTYTCQMYITGKCIEKGWEGIYLVRRVSEIQDGVLKDAFEKVLSEQFPQYDFEYKRDAIYLKSEDEDMEPHRIWRCLAISAYNKIKKKSFPKVHYLLFDEYMIEDNRMYVDGWQEVEHFFTIYDTIDRGEDRVQCFFMGNNLCFHNPYHLHPKINIPQVEQGQIWKSKEVLFQRALPSSSMLKEIKESRFGKMMEGSEYASSAMEGNYVYDNTDYIGKITDKSKYVYTLCLEDGDYGVYYDFARDVVTLSPKVDPTCKSKYAISPRCQREGCIVVGKRGSSLVVWLARKYRNGRVKYDNMKTKLCIQDEIHSIA